MTPTDKARELCAKLIPHLTSVENVKLVEDALKEAFQEGQVHERETINEKLTNLLKVLG